jgi:very-short-patch-repair endonuclease/endogenous inhibitor of DNA gyrase (YacG/DUF329 family)
MENIVNKCENCGKEIVEFNSKRFCSIHCRKSFISKQVKHRVSNLPKTPRQEGGWFCKDCEKHFDTKRELYNHRQLDHPGALSGTTGKHFTPKRNPGGKCPHCGKEYKFQHSLNTHLPRCSKNPDKSKSYVGHPASIETRKLQREKRIAILESNNPNDGFVKRWNRKPSYPELWMAEVINNYFDDKNYISEMAFSRYALDFAWPDKKKCIEMDGSQHKLEKYAESDQRKDKALADAGWAIFRVEWNPRLKHEEPELIKKLKEFIDC